VTPHSRVLSWGTHNKKNNIWYMCVCDRFFVPTMKVAAFRLQGYHCTSILFFYFEDNGIGIRGLHYIQSPVCMQFCKICHPFPSAHNGLLFRKAERVFQRVRKMFCVRSRTVSRFIGSSEGLLGRVESALMLTPKGKKIPLNEIRTLVSSL